MRQDLQLSFLGPQGSGKGTQARLLAEEYHYEIIGMGALLREAASGTTEISRQIREIMARGELVPNQLTIDILKANADKLVVSDGTGYILDGFPRNMDQVNSIADIISLDALVVIDIPDEEIMTRILFRLVCPNNHIYNSKTLPSQKEGVCDQDGLPLQQRNDLSEDAIRNRILVHREQTNDVIEHFKKQNKLILINGKQAIAKVHEDIVEALEKI